MQIKFTSAGGPAGKVADVELHFGPGDGLLAGCKLIGFALWSRRGGASGYNVTFPARQYSVNGERRSFALLRPASFHSSSAGEAMPTEALADAIREAYRRSQADDEPETETATVTTCSPSCVACADAAETERRVRTSAEAIARQTSLL